MSCSPVRLAELGYGPELISVTPPKATLSPNSKIAASSLGKAPGVRYQNGTWGGNNWRVHQATLADINRWVQDGANIGLRAGRYPGLDIDSMNEEIVAKVKELAFELLGPAPVRIGRAPKALLMYRTSEPFTRMRMTLEGESQSSLIELLGEGQQYLVAGVHPATMRPYAWESEPPAAEALTDISIAKAEILFQRIRAHFELAGFTVRREGDGRKSERIRTADQEALRAPSLEALRMAVSAIPNGEGYRSREDWLRMAAAVRAACGDESEDGFDIFSDWCDRWSEGTNDADYVRQNWRRLYPPFAIGWNWIAERARPFGYSTAADDFPADPDAFPAAVLSPVRGPDTEPQPRVTLSEQWLADRVVEEIGDRLRYVKAHGRWLVWDGSRWEPDATEMADHEVRMQLHRLASEQIARAAGDEKQMRVRVIDARRIESAYTLSSVMRLLRADRAVAVAVESLDTDPWALNTPAGVVNLKDGTMTPSLPEYLHTKRTRVAPAVGDAPEWSRFLLETTGGDLALVAYLQRLAGYCLTGITREQVLTFIWGPGGNGKSTFLNAISDVMGDYATVATMEVFTATKMDRHTTDLADLMGARLVTASETQQGRRWDEQRLKSLSAGDLMKARLMRQDNISFRPTFKLVFTGNHQPHIRSLDEAMRRRIQMVPFVVQPAVRDNELEAKLRPEYPAILDWMILGCLQWQREGLNPPEVVLAKTGEYFENEDSIGRWIAERCDVGPEIEGRGYDLFRSWREWCGENNEKAAGAGRAQDLIQALRTRGHETYLHSRDRGTTVRGLAVNRQIDMEAN